MLQYISIIIFIVVMVCIVTEKLHRAVAALAGAAALVIFRVFDFSQAISYVDFNTLGVLLGMMLFVAVVKRSGLFEYVAIKATKLAKGHPWRIMVAFMLITAVFSALLDNVTTVLLIVPMTFTVTRILKVDPVPFLFTQVLASNIGGTATLIGDPPNIMIGSATGFSFADFLFMNGPVVVVIMVAVILVMKLAYGRNMEAHAHHREAVQELDEHAAVKDRSLLHKSIVMILIVAAAFVLHGKLGLESGVIALIAAAIMIIIGRADLEEIVNDVEWPTILFFLGLFIVVGGMEETGVIHSLATLMIDATAGNPVMTMLVLLWASAILSSILDNIPLVATLIPLVFAMGEGGIDVMPLWWAISLGACLGGNGTLIGASANVVVASLSGKHGEPITFKDFFKVGFPVMILTLVITTGYMMLRFG